MTEFESRVQKLAGIRGIPWPLHVANLKVGRVRFEPAHPSLEDEPRFIDAGPGNMKSRVFVDYVLRDSAMARITDEVRDEARRYFGEELVTDALANPGKHRFIDLFLDPHYVNVSAERNPLFELREKIEEAWDNRDEAILAPGQGGDYLKATNQALEYLDNGTVRIAERGTDGAWTTNDWLKKVILLYFKLHPNQLIECCSPGPYFDKVPRKWVGWTAGKFEKAGFRAVPGSIVRHGAFIDKSVILMPSFVNIGAYVGEGTMVDTWATVGSCAQIGKNCHISGGAGIGGVLEPLQANPVIIEDNCFIGARSEVAEGVIVREGSVLSMGVYLGASTPIIDRETGQTFTGEVPPYSVVVAGNRPAAMGHPSTYCAVIIKKVDERTRSKTSINELLRE